MVTRSVPRSVAPSGLVVAGVGFLLTRGTVVLAAGDGPVRFLLSGVVPLALGLGLSAFGVALTVGSVPRSYVRRVAAWCVAGTVTIGGLVGLVVLGRTVGSGGMVTGVMDLRANGYLSAVLIAGSVGGTLTGTYAARSARRRERLQEQAEQMRTRNRLLRDRVLNAVTVIQGRAELLRASNRGTAEAHDHDRSARTLADRSRTIEGTVKDISYLAGLDGEETGGIRARSLASATGAAIDRVDDRYEAAVAVDRVPEATVWADGDLERALYLAVTAAGDTVGPDASIEVTLLESDPAEPVLLCVRAIPAGDDPRDPETDPTASTKLDLLSMLVERYGGTVSAGTESAPGDDPNAETRDRTVVELRLPRASAATTASTVGSTGGRYGIEPPQLGAAVAAALTAGVVMGVAVNALAGAVPVIGALYGLQSPAVGWITHLFHSVVFGVVFAGLLATAPPRYTEVPGTLAIGLGWGVALWAVAAGVVMPLWLQLAGIPATVPQWQVPSLIGHLLWGGTLAAVYYPLGRLVAKPDGDATVQSTDP